MKTLFASLLLFSVAATSYGQRLDSATVRQLPPAAQEEVFRYLHQRKTARTTGILLTSSGGGTIVVGALVALLGGFDNVFGGSDEDLRLFNHTALIISGAGLATAAAGIPFFIKSHRKKLAARAIISNHGISLLPVGGLPSTGAAGAGIVITLGR